MIISGKYIRAHVSTRTVIQKGEGPCKLLPPESLEHRVAEAKRTSRKESKAEQEEVAVGWEQAVGRQ